MEIAGTASEDFARSFGDALNRFLQSQGLTQAEAARRLGLPQGKGKARLNTYCHDSKKGTRPKPDAEILYRVCVELGFTFEFRGYKISAAMLNGKNAKPIEAKAEQLQIEFDGQINLTDQTGIVSVNVKRPSGSVGVEFSLKEATSSHRTRGSSDKR